MIESVEQHPLLTCHLAQRHSVGGVEDDIIRHALAHASTTNNVGRHKLARGYGFPPGRVCITADVGETDFIGKVFQETLHLLIGLTVVGGYLLQVEVACGILLLEDFLAM